MLEQKPKGDGKAEASLMRQASFCLRQLDRSHLIWATSKFAPLGTGQNLAKESQV